MASIPSPDPPPADGTVTLRPWRDGEAPVLAAAWSDPAIQRWCVVPDDCTETAAGAWIAGQERRRREGVALDLAITLDDDQVVGEVGLGPIQWDRRRASLGFWLCAEHRRSGLAAKAVRLVSAWALDTLPLNQLVATASAENPASGWTLAAAGFELQVERKGQQAWVRSTRSGA
jgi:RimJ/RimL family protein N-acetyltransferase